MGFAILPREPSLSELMGTGFGGGFAQGAQTGIEQTVKENQLKRLSEALGFSSPSTSSSAAQPGQPAEASGQKAIPQQQQMSNVEKIATNPQAMMLLASQNPQAANQIQKMYDNLLSQRKLESQQEIARNKLAFQETKDTREAVDNAYKNSIDTNMILSRMEKIDEKDLISPATDALFEKIGLPISLLNNPDSEEYQKLSQNLMKGVTQFGNRILQVEFANFMKQIPTLKNSKEGRRLIIRNMKLLNDMNIAAYKAKKSILKENKGVPPMDLFDQIQDRMAPDLEKIQTDMLSPIKKETKFSKVKEGTALSKDIARDILKASGGDLKKAEKAAKKLGYSF